MYYQAFARLEDTQLEDSGFAKYAQLDIIVPNFMYLQRPVLLQITLL
jgi:hypothetical protein